jgi:hypothetical protein
VEDEKPRDASKRMAVVEEEKLRDVLKRMAVVKKLRDVFEGNDGP